MPDLALPDVSLHYEVSGTGPPLLMLAGMLSDSASWEPLLPFLSADFTLIRPDNRTTGRTTPADAPASPTIWAQDALALLDHLGHSKAHVLGHSLGGNIGWVLTRMAPTRVASYTMLASAPLNLRRNVELFRTLIAIRRSDAPPDAWLRVFFPWIFAPHTYEMPGAIDAALAQALAYPYQQSVEAMAHQLEAVLSADPAPFQTEPDVPTLALLAEDDLLIPFKAAKDALSGIEHRVISGSGHAVHWEAPEKVAQHIRDFALQHDI